MYSEVSLRDLEEKGSQSISESVVAGCFLQAINWLALYPKSSAEDPWISLLLSWLKKNSVSYGHQGHLSAIFANVFPDTHLYSLDLLERKPSIFDLASNFQEISVPNGINKCAQITAIILESKKKKCSKDRLGQDLVRGSFPAVSEGASPFFCPSQCSLSGIKTRQVDFATSPCFQKHLCFGSVLVSSGCHDKAP